jgi:hypothetical protein
MMGNGSFATELQFLARMSPLGKVMKALVVKGEQDFNNYQGQKLQLHIKVDDRGNTGGSAEIDEADLLVDVAAVNDPPVLIAPNQPAVQEDVTMTLTGLEVTDVDVNEQTPSTINLKLEVDKGTLSVTTGLSVSNTVDGNGHVTMIMEGTLAQLNAALATLQYHPNLDENDGTAPGVEQLVITADDLGHHGISSGPADREDTVTVPLHVTAVNDPPVVFAPPYMYTDEDTPMVGLNLTISDVDTYDGIGVTLSVVSGTLTYPGDPAVATITFTDNLDNITRLFGEIIYTPNQNFNGQDTLTIDVTDNQPQNPNMPTMYVGILVEAVNDAPDITYTCPTACTGGAFSGSNPAPGVGVDYSFDGSTDAKPKPVIVDVDSGNEWVQLLVYATKGTVKLSGTTGLTFTYPAVYNPSSPPDLILAMGTVANINSAIDGIIYNRGSAGTDNLLFAVNDMGNTGQGQPGTAVSILTLD